MPTRRAHTRNREFGPLPVVLEGDLRSSDVELIVEAIEQALEHLPLLLQAVAPGETKGHAQDADHHRGIMPRAPRDLRRLFAHLERFEEVADFDVIEPFEADPAFEPFGYFANVFFKPAKGSKLPFVDDDPISNDP